MKKPDLPIPTHKASAFGFTSQKDCGVFASDLGPLGTEWHARVWSDACDTGFTMRSDRTGAEKLFTLADTRTKAGDVEAWVFVSEDGFTATVFND